METKSIVNIYGDVSLKIVKDEMLKTYDPRTVKYVKYKKLYSESLQKKFSKWYEEDLKYIILKINSRQLVKIQASIKSLMSNTIVYIKDGIAIELIPKLKFILISKEPLMMDMSMTAQTYRIEI